MLGSELAANVTKLLVLYEDDGVAVKRSRPRAVPANARAKVRVALSRVVCLEPCAGETGRLGRFVLRQQGRTVAFGTVVEVET